MLPTILNNRRLVDIISFVYPLNHRNLHSLWQNNIPFRCTYCGRSPVTHPGVILHCDHIIPWSKGGKTWLINLQTLCAECNFGKGDMMTISECEN